MTGGVAVLFSIVRAELRELPRGPLRPREHGAGGLEHGARTPLEITHGATGEQMVRLGGHVDPFLALLTPLWLVWPSPLALGFAQVAGRVARCAARVLARPTSPRLGERRRAARARLSRLPVDGHERGAPRSIPVTFAIPLFLFCIWFLDTERLVPFAIFALLAMSTGELMGLPIAALGIWYARRARSGDGPAPAIAAARRWRGRSSRSTSSCRHFSGGDSMFFGFYDEVGGSPVGRR